MPSAGGVRLRRQELCPGSTGGGYFILEYLT